MKRTLAVFRLVILCLSPLACATAVEEQNPAPAAPSTGIVKTPVHDPNKVAVGSINWGLKVANVNEFFLLSGYGATNAEGEVQFKGDAGAQTRFILERIEAFIGENGYSKNDIIRYETTVTTDVPRGQFSDIRAATSSFFSDVEVKPTAATFRIVQGLGNPDMLVELEFWLAR